MKTSGNVLLNFTSRAVPITLYKFKDYIYYYFSYESKVYRGSTGIKQNEGLDQAIDKTRDIVKDVIDGRYRPTRGKHVLTVESLLNQYIETKEQQGLRDKTIYGYKNFSRFLIEFFHKTNVESLVGGKFHSDYRKWRKDYHLNNENVVYVRNGKTIQGKQFRAVGNTTFNRELRLLVSALQWGQENLGILQGQQIKSLETFLEGRREALFDRAEYDIFKEYLKTHDLAVYHLVRFILHTALRFPSEIEKLEYRDIKHDFIIVRDRKYKGRVKHGALNSAVPITKPVREALAYFYSIGAVEKTPNSKIFIRDDGTVLSNIRTIWKRAINEVSLQFPEFKEKNITPYTLRHQAITRFIKMGYSMKHLMEITGHTDFTMISKRYSHLQPMDLVKHAKRIEGEDII